MVKRALQSMVSASEAVDREFLHVVMVGVEDYRALAPDGSSDLDGPAHTLDLWASVFGRMGVGSRIVRLESSVEGGHHAEGADLRRAFDALVDRLKAGPGAQQGIFVFSGHGKRGSDGPMLCPSDTGPDWAGAVPVADLLLRACGLPEHASLTIVLDCCLPVDRPLSPPPGVVVVSAGSLAGEHPAPGGWVGGFSEAATSVLDRWTPFGPRGESGGAFFDLTYHRWLKRTGRALKALGLPRAPRVYGLQHSDQAVFQNPQLPPAPTSPRPTVAWRPLQLDPGLNGFTAYDVKTTSDGIVRGTVMVLAASHNPTNNSWTASSEYWDVNLSAIDGNEITFVTGSEPTNRNGTHSDKWRVDCTNSATTDPASGTVTTGTSWHLHGGTLPAIKVDRPNLKTYWIRTSTANVGTNTYDAVTSDTNYTNKVKTVDAHVSYAS